MRIEPFEIRHFYEIEGREGPVTEEHEWIVKLQYERSFYNWRCNCADPELGHKNPTDLSGRSAVTIYDGDRIVACVGVLLVFRNGAVWIRIVDNPPIFIYRTIKRELNRVISEAGLQRLETEIQIDKTLNHKFVQAFGFNAYAVSRKFGQNGETFVRYEWVRD